MAGPISSSPGEQTPFARTTCLLIFLATIAAFGPTVTLPFVQDDWGVIVENEDLTLENLPYMGGKTYWDKELPFDDPWRPGHYLYRPLPIVMFAIEKAIFGLNAWGFRLTNLFLHALSACFVALLVARMLGGCRHAWRVAKLSGLLFAVHAVHFEPVYHIVGRAELGMTATTLAALLCVEKAAKNVRWVIVMLALGMVATLFKEQGLLSPLLVLSCVPLSAKPWSNRTLLTYTSGTLLWTVAYLGLRNYAIQGYSPSEGIILPLAGYPFFERAAIMAAALVDYLRLLVLPIDPLLDYQHLALKSPKTFAAFPPLLGILIASGCLVVLIVGFRQKRLYAVLGAGLIVVGLGPVSNIFFPIGAVIAERFLYLPSAGVCFLIAGLLKGPLRSKLVIGLSALPLVFMVSLCWHHTYHFRDPLRVASRMVRLHPDAPRLQHLAAEAFEKFGRLKEARAAWEQQKALEPENKSVDIHLTRLALRQLMAGRTSLPPDAEANLVQQLREHLERLKPLKNLGEAPLLRGKIYHLVKEFDEARIEFLNAVFNNGRNRSAKREAARALLEMERLNLGSTTLNPELKEELKTIAR